MRTTAMRLVSVAALLSFAVPAAAAAGPSFMTHTNVEYDFTVEIPTTWIAEDPNEESEDLIILSRFTAPQKRASDTPTQVSLMVQTLPSPADQGRETQLTTKEYVDAFLSDFSLLRRQKARITRKPGELITYSFTDSEGTKRMNESVIAVNEDAVLILTITSSPRGLRQHYRAWRRIIRTLK